MKKYHKIRRRKNNQNPDNFFQPEAEKKAGFFENKGKDPFFNANPSLQPKLTVGQPGDKYEQQADAMADKMVQTQTESEGFRSKENELGESKLQMQEEEEAAQPKLQLQEEEEAAQPMLQKEEEEEAAMPKLQMEEEEEAAQPKLQKQEEEEEAAQPKLQKQEEEEEAMMPKLQKQEEEEAAMPKLQKQEEEALQAQPMEEEEEMMQPKAETKPQTPSSQFQKKLKKERGKGSKLPAPVAKEMSSFFNADFSNVNIHTDSESEQLNSEINAQAFAHGKDVFFNKNKFNPNTKEGKHLLAHELTHIVQQNPKVRKKPKKK